SDHLRGVGFPGVGRDFDLIGTFHDVVVGHGITIGRNEKARTLAHHAPGPAVVTGPLRHAIGTTELAEEALHGRSRSFVIASVANLRLLHRDLDRDHRRLHALHHV